MNKEQINALLKDNVSNIRQIQKLLVNGNGNGNGDYSYTPKYSREFRDKIKALPVYEELSIHYLGLVGYVYRHLKTNPRVTIDKVYTLALRARQRGARYVRSFLMNGKRTESERYMVDALPWVTTNGIIDFDRDNAYYWECVKIVEKACRYWNTRHRPTFWMDRYNYDIFDRSNNKQKIHGYRSEEALKVKIDFMCDYALFQEQIIKTPMTFEIENEPSHKKDHGLGGLIADQNLEMWRAVESLNLGSKIADVWTCSGTSEFSHANFVGRHYAWGRHFGSAEFKSREVKAEYHNVSTLDSLLRHNWDKALGSGWPQLCNNEDAANDGSYSPIPWTKYKQANYEESLEMCEYAIKTTRARRKRWYFTYFSMDSISLDSDGIAKETYNMNTMNWLRMDAYRTARMKLD